MNFGGQNSDPEEECLTLETSRNSSRRRGLAQLLERGYDFTPPLSTGGRAGREPRVCREFPKMR